MANSSTSQSTTTGSLEDLLSLSPAAQQLAQAPSAVVNAMGDLLSGQKDVQGDLSQLKSFFQQNPQNLASLLSSLQGSSGTYGVSNASGTTNTLLTALMNQQSNASDPSALLSLLGNQGQDTLFSYRGDSSTGSASSSSSLFG